MPPFHVRIAASGKPISGQPGDILQCVGGDLWELATLPVPPSANIDVLPGVRFVAANTTATTPNGSIAAPFARPSQAIASLTVAELADPFGYTIICAPGDYSDEDLIDLPGGVATFVGWGSNDPISARLHSITSGTVHKLTLRDIWVHNLDFDSCDVFLDNAYMDGGANFISSGRVYSFGALQFLTDPGIAITGAATEVDWKQSWQALAGVNISGQLLCNGTQVIGPTTCSALAFVDTDTIALAPGDGIDVSGSVEVTNGVHSLVFRHTGGESCKFVNCTLSAGVVFLETSGTEARFFGCQFGAGTEVTFTGAPGVLLLDPISHYYFTLNSGVVNNGSVTVVS